jgi:hypothetical protein
VVNDSLRVAAIESLLARLATSGTPVALTTGHSTQYNVLLPTAPGLGRLGSRPTDAGRGNRRACGRSGGVRWLAALAAGRSIGSRLAGEQVGTRCGTLTVVARWPCRMSPSVSEVWIPSGAEPALVEGVPGSTAGLM